MSYDDAPLLADLLPWSIAPLRLGRGWPMAPDASCLEPRWRALTGAQGEQRRALFEPSRARALTSAVAQLPGQRTGTGQLLDEAGPCPAPVRVLHGPFDEQWLIPDHRLIDAARPELWRVADAAQLFAVEQGQVPGTPGPALLVTGLLPDGRSPAGRPGRIRPLYRRPGGTEPNVVPGLLGHLAARLDDGAGPAGAVGTGTPGTPGSPVVGAETLLAWALAVAAPAPGGCAVPLTADRELWAAGTDLGARMLRLLVRDSVPRPRLPGGQRPYVRAPLPRWPGEVAYDPGEETLCLGTGRIAPVTPDAWELRVSGVRVLELWLARRAQRPGPGSLDAVGWPGEWPQAWTSQLLELITVLTLFARLGDEQTALLEALRSPGTADAAIGTAELRAAGVLPVPGAARRPASVLDHHEEGPGGQIALL